jgi:hypothetical protein
LDVPRGKFLLQSDDFFVKKTPERITYTGPRLKSRRSTCDTGNMNDSVPPARADDSPTSNQESEDRYEISNSAKKCAQQNQSFNRGRPHSKKEMKKSDW